MFERNRVDYASQRKCVAVELLLDDGHVMTGRISMPVAHTFFDALNGPEAFVDFECFAGRRTFLAKASLRSVRQLDAKPVTALKAGCATAERFDPYSVLGVSPGVDADGLRHAYLERSKTYHPDRFANVELPEEVRDYLQSVARQVNVAYEALQATLPAIKPVRSEPIWESRDSA